MASVHHLGDLRVAIEDAFRNVMAESENGEAPNEVVLSRVKTERDTLVKLFTPQLIDIALTKLLNEVCQKKIRGLGQSDQGDLFGRFGKIPKRVSVARGLKKETVNLTIKEAKDWLKKHSTRVVENDNEAFEKMVEVCAKHTDSENDTIAVALQRMSKDENFEDEVIENQRVEELVPAE